MYILKTETLEHVRKIYWTVDGEHIFRVQIEPLFSKRNGKDNVTRDDKHVC